MTNFVRSQWHLDLYHSSHHNSIQRCKSTFFFPLFALVLSDGAPVAFFIVARFVGYKSGQASQTKLAALFCLIHSRSTILATIDIVVWRSVLTRIAIFTAFLRSFVLAPEQLKGKQYYLASQTKYIYKQITYGRHWIHIEDIGSASQPSGQCTHGIIVLLITLPAAHNLHFADGSSSRSWYLPLTQSRQFVVALWNSLPAGQNLQVTGTNVLLIWCWYLPLSQSEQTVVPLTNSVPGWQ